MKIFAFFLPLSLAAVLPHAAWAHDVKQSPQHAACMGKSGGVTVEMLDCIGAETKVQDTRLNQAYKELMATLAPARKKQLQEAQRAWIKFRDANCGFYADPDGGTMATVSASDCFMSMTTDRAKELQNLKP